MSRIVIASLVLSALAILINAYNIGAQSAQPYLDQCIRRERAWVERAEERHGRERECIISAPPICYEQWHRITVPTCDGGTQTLEAP